MRGSRSFAARGEHRDELVDAAGRPFAERTTAEWMEELRGVVPIAPVRSLEEALDRDELAGAGCSPSTSTRRWAAWAALACRSMSSDFAPTYAAGPRFGEDQDGVLAEVGYSGTEIAALRANGAFGTSPGDGVEAPTAAT